MNTPCSRCDRPAIAKGLCASHYGSQRISNQKAVVNAAVRVCRNCQRDFAGKDRRAIYCSRACNNAAQTRVKRDRLLEERPERRFPHCDQCGIALDGIKRSDARFCSAKCGHDYRNAGLALQTRENRKPCAHCGSPIPLGKRRFCSAACTIAHRKPEKYGFTQDELVAFMAQHPVCAICGTTRWGKKGPVIDHDHATGKVRGVLCGNCNMGLGRFADDPARIRLAVAYLESRPV